MSRIRFWFWSWSCLLSLGLLTRALEQEELFEFGEAAGDQRLPPGSDSSAELRLNGTVFFFSNTFSKVYINTNGFVAFDSPPAEAEYLGKMPATFGMIAALLGDLDAGADPGKVYYREDGGPAALSRAAEHIRRAFPRDGDEEPTSVLIVTWETVSGRGDGLAGKKNTFQLVVAMAPSSSYAVLLYPRDTLQFLSTAVGGGAKLLEAGFNQGLVQGWFWNTEQGTYFRITSDDETSVRDLTEKTTSGQKGVWVYEIGTSPFFTAIAPGMISGTPEEEEEEAVTEPPVTTLARQPEVTFSTYEPQVATDRNEEFPTESPIEYQPGYPQPETTEPEFFEPETEEPDYEDTEQPENPESVTVSPTYADPESAEPTYPTEPKSTEQTETGYPEPSEPRYPEPSEPRYPEPSEPRYPEPSEPRYPEPSEPRYPEPSEPRYPEQTETGYPVPEPSEPRFTNPDTTETRNSPVEPRYTNPEAGQPAPPYSQPHQPQIVVVDEDDDLDVDVFAYNLETCANSRHKCSSFADCRDYSNGYCCRCRPGFYGNGKDCVAEGKPQRMNGKVNGRVFVGNSASPVDLGNQDLHSYVVANDGRAYVAISNISLSLGPSLQPLSSVGGVIGWAFALEQPGYQNGFSLVGGVFSRQAEVVFQPGNERLSIRQRFKGIDEHDHLVVSTEVDGRVPAVPPGSSVQIHPYKEIYQYDRNLITSSSNRDYTVTSPDGAAHTSSYQWRQTITYESCPHDDGAAESAPPTQQLSVDQIFVMFDEENRLIRYAMTNRIGSVHSVLPEQNPCFTGRHGCDLNAACRPGEGLRFTCECSNGFAGDGRYCHDVDECRETTPHVCGPNAVCSNQPGSFRCECSRGFVFGSDGKTCIEELRPVDHCQTGSHDCDAAERAACVYSGGSSFVCSCLPGFDGDGRVCRDVDECQQDRCHRDASCINTHGSFTCRCHPGFYGDGFQCSPSSSEREPTRCERHRDSAQAATSSSGFFSFFRPRPAVGHFVPKCDEHGAYEPTQCHASIGQCWCVDANGEEVPNTRGGHGATPLCIDHTVTPPSVGPTPRPDVHPVAPGTHLLFAQSGKIEHVPLDGYEMRKQDAKPLLHVPDRVVIAVAYDCVDKMVYWTDITAPAISRASVDGGDVTAVVTTDLQSPEGVAVDHVSRLLFWTDSVRDTVEVSQLDGSRRRVLFDTDLVNPRPIVTNPPYGRLYWADWNRDGPKIEMSNMDGSDRSVLVKDDLGLPNGLTFDADSQQLCWADAGTRRVECMDPHRRLRRTIVDGIQYPFALVSFGRKLYYTDWRREAVVAVDRQSETETDEFLPSKRSRVYGITTTTTQCPQAYNYCANNGGCSHLCLPRLGGFTCRCPDAAAAAGRCEETRL